MLQINTSFDDADAQALLRHWMIETKNTMHDAVVRAGRVAARSFGESTWPKTQESGERAVNTQIRRVYATKGDAFQAIKDAGHDQAADAFYYFATSGASGGMKRARLLLQKYGGKMAGVPLEKFDKGEAHDRARKANVRGRVPKGLKPRQVVWNDGQNAKGETPLDKYMRQKRAMVGFTQSAWYNCLMLLGGRNRRSKSKGMTREGTELTKPFAKWVQRHKGKGFGKVFFNEEPERFGVVLHNDVRWSQHALEPGAERWIMRQSREYLIKSLMLDIIETRNAAERKQA